MKHEVIPPDMTVRDLITILGKHDPDTVVTISQFDDELVDYYTVENITYGSTMFTNDKGNEEYGKIVNLS